MTEWLRRDEEKCRSGTVIAQTNGSVTLRSDRSYALFWQIPLRDDTAMALDQNEFDWLRECGRPPADFHKEIDSRGADRLLTVEDTPWFSWRWKVDVATIREQSVEEGGKMKTKYKDYPAKIGISILKKDSNDLREVSYVWSPLLEDDLMFYSETTIIPFVWKLKWGRIVAEGGRSNIGRWVTESRNLYDDYRRIYPGEEPGRIVRVYISTDGDNTGSEAQATYADFEFHSEPPAR